MPTRVGRIYPYDSSIIIRKKHRFNIGRRVCSGISSSIYLRYLPSLHTFEQQLITRIQGGSLHELNWISNLRNTQGKGQNMTLHSLSSIIINLIFCVVIICLKWRLIIGRSTQRRNQMRSFLLGTFYVLNKTWRDVNQGELNQQ